MTRSATLGSLLFLLLLPALSSAQTSGEYAAAEQALPASGLPGFDTRTVPGESVVALADFIVGYLADAGDLPELAQVGTTRGQLRSVSMAEAFALLARTAYLWQTAGELPASVPISPDEVSSPVLDREDLAAGEFDPEGGVEVLTTYFLAVCGDTVRWVDRLGVIPTAVWVDGTRLSATQYLAGLAICIQYAYWEGELYDSVFLPDYSPPQSWLPVQVPEPTPSAAEFYASGEPNERAPSWGTADTAAALPSQEQTWEERDLWNQPLAPLSNLPAPGAASAASPEFVIYPEPGSTLSGIADLVVSYRGPRERFVMFEIDGRSRIITNFPPYSYRWDTSDLKPGTHTVRVQVLGDDEMILVDQVSAFTVMPPAAGSPQPEPPDDL